jgi:hypothetical protein
MIPLKRPLFYSQFQDSMEWDKEQNTLFSFEQAVLEEQYEYNTN